MKHTKQIQISETQIARVYPDEHPTNPNDINDEVIVIYRKDGRAIEHKKFNIQDIRLHKGTESADEETKTIYRQPEYEDWAFFPIRVKGGDTIELERVSIFQDIHGYICLLKKTFFQYVGGEMPLEISNQIQYALREMAAYANGEMYRVEIINLETCPHCNHTKEEVGNSYGSFIDEAAAIEFIETNFLIL